MSSRKAFLHVGGFDERLSGYEDDDLFLRLFRAGFDSVFLREPLSRWRIFQGSSSYSPRMAVSRMVYVQTLIERFPNDKTKSLFYVRHLVAPRFLRVMLDHFRRCVQLDDRKQQRVAVDHLAFIVRHTRARWRVPLRYFVVPAMRVPFLARFIVNQTGPLTRIFRRIPGSIKSVTNYDERCFLPIHVYDTATSRPVAVLLRTARRRQVRRSAAICDGWCAGSACVGPIRG